MDGTCFNDQIVNAIPQTLEETIILMDINGKLSLWNANEMNLVKNIINIDPNICHISILNKNIYGFFRNHFVIFYL